MSLDYEIRFPHSLGLFYSAFTQFLGFEVNDGEYKVMGLAPFGQPKYQKQVEMLIDQSSDGAFKLHLDFFNFIASEKVSFSQKFVDLFGIPVNHRSADQVKQKYADIASSVQKVLEDKVVKIASEVRKKTGQENLCYSGGVALNGVANWQIFKRAGFKNIFIHPAAGDAGGALGAALYFYHQVLNKKRTNIANQKFNPYLGERNSLTDIDNFINQNKIQAEYLSDAKLVKKVASLLAKKKVVGWVRGEFEWGPRALGNRSILADPRDKKMKDLVNSKIKFREGFRPFAPSTLYEKGSEFFMIPKNFPPILEYMLAVVPVRKKWQQKLAAVTHVDETARPQFLRRENNPIFYDLIKSFGQTTGVPVLLNTSFNLKGEPIVNTAKEAYETFIKSGLDALVLENYLILK